VPETQPAVLRSAIGGELEEWECCRQHDARFMSDIPGDGVAREYGKPPLRAEAQVDVADLHNQPAIGPGLAIPAVELCMI
jgi:hypothetical protein